MPPAQLAVVEADRERDVAVPDEHERLLRRREGLALPTPAMRTYSQTGSRGLPWQSATPSRLAVGSRDARNARRRRRARSRVQRAAASASPTNVVEVDLAEDDEVVVAGQADVDARSRTRVDALVRPRPVADESPRHQISSTLRRVDVCQHRLEGVQICVNVGDDGDAHRQVCGTLAGAWLVVAALLWRTSVPQLDAAELDPAALFGEPRWRGTAATATSCARSGRAASLAQLARSRARCVAATRREPRGPPRPRRRAPRRRRLRCALARRAAVPPRGALVAAALRRHATWSYLAVPRRPAGRRPLASSRWPASPGWRSSPSDACSAGGPGSASGRPSSRSPSPTCSSTRSLLAPRLRPLEDRPSPRRSRRSRERRARARRPSRCARRGSARARSTPRRSAPGRRRA